MNREVMSRVNQSTTLSGWGNCPAQPCRLRSADTWNAVRSEVSSVEAGPIIARGLGRSYGDSSLNDQGTVLRLNQLNRLLAFDHNTGTLECESGVSFAEIIDVFLPQGWFLPTTPGTKFVTVGGAIAADVHGKNHHRDGSFGNFVDRITLQLANGAVVECSRQNDEELFWATVGGMGLTGIILKASIRLMKVASAYCEVDYRRTPNLDSTLDMFQSTGHRYRYSVAWIDCLATGDSLGRSVVMLGNHASPDQLTGRASQEPFAMPRKRGRSVPFHFPSSTLNPLSVRIFNELYYAKHGDHKQFVDFNTYFYPLDGVEHWNRIYGRAGFVQYQALFPTRTARDGLRELMECISRSRQASFLAVLKESGASTPGLLSYLYPGYTLALDFPYRGAKTRSLFEKLDQIVLDHQGRLYLAKDALTSAETFQRMYPRLPEFQAVKARVDPENRFMSSQARRLGIAGEATDAQLALSTCLTSSHHQEMDQ